MNKIERYIYNILRSSPAMKNQVRDLYHGFFDILPRPKPRLAYPIVARKGYFYGFHDHSPFSSDDSRLLANTAPFDLRMPRKNETLKVGYFDGNDFKDFNHVAETRAWNWHMGCKLQWRGNSNELIFNDHIDGGNVSRIIDIHTQKEIILPDSIGSVSPDGQWAVGYSFARVNKLMPGYGYVYQTNESDVDSSIPSASGIYKINLNTCEKTELVSIGELASISSLPSMRNRKHFFTHTVISPDSTRFIFLHRWVDPDDDISKRFSRLVVCDFDGNMLDIFKTDEMVSHISWKDSEHVLAYCRDPVFDDKYILFKVGAPEESLVIGGKTLTSDGHPSYDCSGRWIVTDTYQNRRRVQSLILHDTQTDTRYDVAQLPGLKKYQSPSPFQHWACDLHPRWSRTGRYLCFDSAYNGVRSLCTIDLRNDLLLEQLKYIKRYE